MLFKLRLGGIGMACLVLAACGGGGGGTPSPTPTPSPTATQVATATPVPTATPSPLTITDGGSTNRKPFTILLNYNDTTATVMQDNTTRSATVTAAAESQLYMDVLANLPLNNVATNNGCTKSASYGSTTSLTYNSASTQDISCPPSSTSAAQTLYGDVETIENQAGPFNN